MKAGDIVRFRQVPVTKNPVGIPHGWDVGLLISWGQHAHILHRGSLLQISPFDVELEVSLN